LSLAGRPGTIPAARPSASGANTRAARDPAGSAGIAATPVRPATGTAPPPRASAPPELRGQIQSLQHDALVTMRALLDAYIERGGESPARSGSPVEDIPIE
jgi:hypothetical protein